MCMQVVVQSFFRDSAECEAWMVSHTQASGTDDLEKWVSLLLNEALVVLFFALFLKHGLPVLMFK